MLRTSTDASSNGPDIAVERVGMRSCGTMPFMADETPPGNGWRRLARDVGVNVTANLIAAAIIYLLAVAGGYLNANRWIIAGILTFPIILVTVAVMLYIVVLANRWGRWQMVGVGLVLVLLAGATIALGYLHMWAG